MRGRLDDEGPSSVDEESRDRSAAGILGVAMVTPVDEIYFVKFKFGKKNLH